MAPAETTVLLLPALDATPDARNMQAPRRSVISHRAQYEFLTRGFKVFGEKQAAAVANRSPAIDLDSLLARTPAELDRLAKRAGADWVVNVVVQDVDANPDDGGRFKIKSRVLLQVWDAPRREWRIDSPVAGEADGEGSPVMLFMQSLDRATAAALTPLLDGLPKVIALEAEASLVDYLANQPAPSPGEGNLASAPGGAAEKSSPR